MLAKEREAAPTAVAATGGVWGTATRLDARALLARRRYRLAARLCRRAVLRYPQAQSGALVRV